MQKTPPSRRMPPLRKAPYRRNVVVAEAASGVLRNRRRKRPPWLLCSESKVLCAFGTALSPTVTVARALIGTRPLTEACLPTNAFMSRRTRLPTVKAHPSPAGACLLRSRARAIFAMRWSATQKPPSNSSCRARRPHLTFQQGIASFLMGFRFMQPWRTHAFDAREAESRLPFARGRFIHGRSCESTTACT